MSSDTQLKALDISREVDSLLSELPNETEVNVGRARNQLIQWLKEPIALPLIFKESYERHFKEKINLFHRDQKKDRVTWLIKMVEIKKLKNPEVNNCIKVDLDNSPGLRTLKRLKEWAKDKGNDSSKPTFRTIDSMLNIYGYEPLSPRLQEELAKYLTACRLDGKNLIGLESVGKTFRISKSAYSYRRSLLDPNTKKDFLQYSFFDSLCYMMDLLELDVIKLKQG